MCARLAVIPSDSERHEEIQAVKLGCDTNRDSTSLLRDLYRLLPIMLKIPVKSPGILGSLFGTLNAFDQNVEPLVLSLIFGG